MRPSLNINIVVIIVASSLVSFLKIFFSKYMLKILATLASSKTDLNINNVLNVGFPP